MKISPMASPQNMVTGNISGTNTSQHDGNLSLRSLKMNTNATPEWQRPDIQAQVQELPPAQKLSNPTTNEGETEATQPLSPQFAALAKQRRALQVKERELAEKEKALSSPQEGQIPLARLKSEPLKVLLESGVTYEQLTEQILANQGNQEVYALKAEIEALKNGVDQKFKDRETQAEQQALMQMRQEAQRLIAQGDDFELVRETRNLPNVMKLIERTYRQSGEVLDVKEACKLVEDHLFNEAQRMAKLNKVQSQLIPQTPPPQMQRQPVMRTLTNRDTATVPMTAKQRALAAFYGTLK